VRAATGDAPDLVPGGAGAAAGPPPAIAGSGASAQAQPAAEPAQAAGPSAAAAPALYSYTVSLEAAGLHSQPAVCVVREVKAPSMPRPHEKTLFTPCPQLAPHLQEVLPCNLALCPGTRGQPIPESIGAAFACAGFKLLSACLLEGSATMSACPYASGGPPAALEQRALQSPAIPASNGSLCSASAEMRRHGLEADAAFARARAAGGEGVPA